MMSFGMLLFLVVRKVEKHPFLKMSLFENLMGILARPLPYIACIAYALLYIAYIAYVAYIAYIACIACI